MNESRVSPLDGSRRHDVVVVGAGPAGSLAAFRLAEAGARVAILEKAVIPRYKTCGGGLTGRARRLLPFDVSASVEHECPTAEIRFEASGIAHRVTREQPLVSMTMRADLDARLLEEAERRGATCHSPCAPGGLEETADEVRITTARGTLRTSYLIGADGALGTVARLAGWPHLPAIPALEWEIEVDPETHRRFAGVARFDFEVVPRGYAWIFPKRRSLSVGALAARGPGHGLAALVDRYLAKAGVPPPRRIERHGFLIPTTPREFCTRGRILLCGDAAGLADPLTGEGIHSALLSGELAAGAILAGELDPRRTAIRYREAIEARILAEHRVARLLAGFLFRPSATRRLMFRRFGNLLAEAMGEVILGRLGYREAVLSPRNYLRLLARPHAATRSAKAGQRGAGIP